MRLRLISAFAAALSLSPVLAHATASEAAGFTWTGMFIGINAGYGRGNSDWDFKSGGSGSNSKKIDGGLVGLQAGYNAQLANNLVAGIEVSTEATNIGGKSRCSGNSCESGIGSLSDVSGRLGVNYRESLLFGKLGVAYQNSENSIKSPGIENKDRGGSLGFVAGAGVEFYIDNNITSNIEYNYYHFNNDSTTINNARIDDSLGISVVKAGLNLKFN